jgi:outer membrane protein assembly factor BamB
MNSEFSQAKRCLLVVIALMLLLYSSPGWAGGADEEPSWPQWRGPNRDGISDESDWDPEALAGGPRLLWHVNIGQGHSNVAITEGRLYTMARTGAGAFVLCLSAATGREAWRCRSGPGWTPQATPSLDGEYLYALSYYGILLCLERKRGRLLWSRDLLEEFDAQKPTYGYGTSPAVEGDLVIVNINDTGIAVNKLTGKEVWKGDLYDSSGKQPHNYATPVFYDHDGRRYSLIFSRPGLFALDPETGEQLWFYEWMKTGSPNAVDPVLFDNKVFISSSEADARGAVLDISGAEPVLVWENHDMANHFSSCVYIDGYLYGVDGDYHTNIKRCTLRCMDAETGELMWVEPTGGASLTAADGKLIVLTAKGTLHIIEATPKAYVEISSCKLPMESGMHWWWTPPVLCGGRIYCRNYSGDLLCIDVRK